MRDSLEVRFFFYEPRFTGTHHIPPFFSSIMVLVFRKSFSLMLFWLLGGIPAFPGKFPVSTLLNIWLGHLFRAVLWYVTVTYDRLYAKALFAGTGTLPACFMVLSSSGHTIDEELPFLLLLFWKSWHVDLPACTIVRQKSPYMQKSSEPIGSLLRKVKLFAARNACRLN